MSKWLKYAPIIIFFLYIVAYLFSFFTSSEQQLINIFDDDAYYYFKIARNLLQTGRTSFDGITLTNGFHPLWLLVITPFFYVWQDPVLVLRLVGIFSTILVMITGLLCLRYLLDYPILTNILVSAVTISCLISFGITGMETALVLPLMMGTLLILEESQLWSQPVRKNRLLFIGILLSAMQLSRLDSVFLGLAILSILFLGALIVHRKFLYTNGLILGVFPLMSGLLYLLYNDFTFGRFIPTSGIVKSLGNSGIQLNQHFLNQMFTFNDPVNGNLWVVYLGITGVCFIYVLQKTIVILRGDTTFRLKNDFSSTIVVVFFIIYLAYHLFRTTWILGRWYAYPVLPVICFVLPGVLKDIETRLGQYPTINKFLQFMKYTLVPLVLIRLVIIALQWGLWSKYLGPAFKYENYLLANQLNQGFNESAIYAVGDKAGSFGYFFEGKVLQLEGLVGDYKLLDAIESDTLMNYISDLGVQYIVSHDSPPPADYRTWELLIPFPEFSSGPHATIELCQSSEYLRYEAPYTIITIWKWPSC